jgi:hypothetical protein
LALLIVTTPLFGQLGLGRGDRNPADYRNRAQRFSANRSVESTLRNRLKERSLLTNHSNAFKVGIDRKPLFFSPQFGIIGNRVGPRDHAARSLRSLQVYNSSSEFAKGVINMPHASDYLIGSSSTWTVEAVLNSSRTESRTELLIPIASTAVTPRLSNTDPAADAYFEQGTTAFRAALAEKDPSDRSKFMGDARHAFDLVILLENDAPRGHLALAIVRYIQEDVNSSLTHLVMGIKRSQSLEEMNIGRENFFADIGLWQRTLEDLNIATRSGESARFMLLYSFFAFLNDDLIVASSVAREAERKSLASIDQSGEDEELRRSIEAEVEYAKRFQKLLGTKTDSPVGGD